MAQKSAIEWTESTWNPVTGCTKLSAGCDNCYAERFAERFRGVVGHPYEEGFDLTLRPARVDQPRSWRRPRLIFVNSMSDLFHEDVPWEYVERVFDTMEAADWHVYQVLTKRSSRMRNFVNRRYGGNEAPPQIWLGTSIENASSMGRLRHLKQTNASVRFLSLEPLLGPLGELDLDRIHWGHRGWRKWPRSPTGCGRMAARNPGRLPDSDRRVLLQAMGRTHPEVRRERARRAPVARVPEHHGSRAREHAAGSRGCATAREPRRDGHGGWSVGAGEARMLAEVPYAYTTILRKQRFRGYFYIDAFAGPSNLKLRDEPEEDPAQQYLLEPSDYESDDEGRAEYLKGSPRVALQIKHPFTHYVFIELNSKRVRQLEELTVEARKAGPKVYVRQRDCNEYLTEFLQESREHWRNWRGVVFLDPFGMQVPWNTVAELGRTGAIEVFINFPVGMAIQRLLKKNGQFSPNERAKLDSYFGTDEWFDLLYREKTDLFGEVGVDKLQNAGDRLGEVVPRETEGSLRARDHREGGAEHHRPSALLPHLRRPEQEGSGDREPCSPAGRTACPIGGEQPTLHPAKSGPTTFETARTRSQGDHATFLSTAAAGCNLPECPPRGSKELRQDSRLLLVLDPGGGGGDLGTGRGADPPRLQLGAVPGGRGGRESSASCHTA